MTWKNKTLQKRLKMKNDSSKSSDPVNGDQTKLSSLTSVVIDEEERRAKQKESEKILLKQGKM